MKNSSTCSKPSLRFTSCLDTLAVAAALALCGGLGPASPMATAATYTGQGRFIAVPFPGIWMTTNEGRYGVHQLLVTSTDPRIAGRRTVNCDVSVNPNGTMRMYGALVDELGTWNLADTNNPIFTPTGGYWEGTWQGLMQADLSFTLQVVTRGHGGDIEGQMRTETATRSAAANPYDPIIPVLYTGSYGPGDTFGTTVIDDFNDGVRNASWSLSSNPSGTGYWQETNQMLTLQGEWTGGNPCLTCLQVYAWYPQAWQVEEGKTIELRTDVININQPDILVHISLVKTFGQSVYNLYLGQMGVYLLKVNGGSFAMFIYDTNSIKCANVVLAMALTGAGNDVLITCRVLDKDNNNAVLYERTVRDTPDSDPSMVGTVEMPTGWSLYCGGDVAGPPLKSGPTVLVCVKQYPGPGQLGAFCEASFDNLVYQIHAGPLLSIEKAVRVSWPARPLPTILESAPTPQGPWSPLMEPIFDWNGIKQMTVPVRSYEKLFIRAK